MGQGTNNTAELFAIRRGLSLVSDFLRLPLWQTASEPVTIYSDSEYAIGSASHMRDWQPRANTELVLALRNQRAQFTDLAIRHVPGHSGVIGNEVADWLAFHARRRWQARVGAKVSAPRKRPLWPGEVAHIVLPIRI